MYIIINNLSRNRYFFINLILKFAKLNKTIHKNKIYILLHHVNNLHIYYLLLIFVQYYSQLIVNI